MRTLALLSLVAVGCNAEIIAAGDRHGGASPDGGGAPHNVGPGGGDGGTQQPQPCPDGQHLESGVCVDDAITCANEFPCPSGMTCSGGRCIQVPGPCASNNDCPVGDVCTNGQCAPECSDQNSQCKTDKDCGPSQLCVACTCVSINQCAKPSADVSGAPWTAHQDLHLDEALGDFGKTVVGILKNLRDGILMCPKGSSNDCFLFEIIAGFLPDWAQTLIVGLANFGDLIDNHDFLVDSTMTFTKNGKPAGYAGVDHWNMLTFSYQNQVVMEKPENVPQIGKPVNASFEASAVCGILYVDKHDIDGVLAGILKWIVDTAVEISTNGQYHDLGDAIQGAIDCAQVNDVAAQALCFTFTSGLKKKIDDAIAGWLLKYSLMTLQGTAVIAPTGKALDDGHWNGTLGDGIGIFKNFTGEWTAKR